MEAFSCEVECQICHRKALDTYTATIQHKEGGGLVRTKRVCWDCWREIDRKQRLECERCGRPHDGTPHLCLPKDLQGFKSQGITMQVPGKLKADEEAAQSFPPPSPHPEPSPTPGGSGGERKHSGSKYVREIKSAVSDQRIAVDVYSVLEAFQVTCPARQHAIKKLLCAGLRGKGSELDDLQEAIDAIRRAVELQQQRESHV
ncbi:MAG TPA: hypothetical protein VEI97_14195 [bacterium]|nr:hypothetical protein [bacterium]